MRQKLIRSQTLAVLFLKIFKISGFSRFWTPPLPDFKNLKNLEIDSACDVANVKLYHTTTLDF